jgi:hypothetical protein
MLVYRLLYPAIFIVLALSHVAAQADSSSEPVILDPPFVDLGTVFQGDLGEATFKIENRTTEGIEIYEVSKSCSCTNIELSKNRLQQNDVSNLKVDLSIGDRLGKFESVVVLGWKSDSGKHTGELKIRISLVAVRAAILNPTELDFGKIKSGLSTVKFFEIKKATTSKDWDTLTAISSKLGELGAKDLGESHFVVEYPLDSKNLPVGIFKDTVEFFLKDTGGRLVHKLTAPIIADIGSDLSISPASLYFGVMPIDSPLNRTFEINVPSGSPREDVKLESQDAQTTLASEWNSSGNLTVQYRRPPQGSEGPFVDKVTVTLQNSGRNLTIPVMAFFKKK